MTHFFFEFNVKFTKKILGKSYLHSGLKLIFTFEIYLFEWNIDAPVCSWSGSQSLSIARGSSTPLQCDVSADPPVLRFRWYLNHTSESSGHSLPTALNLTQSSELPDRTEPGSTGYSQTAVYTPNSRFDYGNLLCMAENSLGSQSQPCLFQILPAGKKLIKILLFCKNNLLKLIDNRFSTCKNNFFILSKNSSFTNAVNVTIYVSYLWKVYCKNVI